MINLEMVSYSQSLVCCIRENPPVFIQCSMYLRKNVWKVKKLITGMGGSKTDWRHLPLIY
jgi:hypothetical protein